METLPFMRSNIGDKGANGKAAFNSETAAPRRLFTTRKPNGRIQKQTGKDSEAATITHREPSQKAATRERTSVSLLEKKKKTLATDIKIYLNDKLLSPIKEESGNEARERGGGSVTPDCMTPFIRHSFSDCPDQ